MESTGRGHDDSEYGDLRTVVYHHIRCNPKTQEPGALSSPRFVFTGREDTSCCIMSIESQYRLSAALLEGEQVFTPLTSEERITASTVIRGYCVILSIFVTFQGGRIGELRVHKDGMWHLQEEKNQYSFRKQSILVWNQHRSADRTSVLH